MTIRKLIQHRLMDQQKQHNTVIQTRITYTCNTLLHMNNMQILYFKYIKSKPVIDIIVLYFNKDKSVSLYIWP